MGVKVAPSILSADFARLADDVARVRPFVDLLHVDVMDNHYVPNLTIGPPVVRSLRQHTDLFLDCHLMVTDPGSLLEPLAEAGADGVTIHVELGDPRPLISRMRALELHPALTMNPSTTFEAVEPYLELVDLLLVMSVHPGFGGQAFIPEVLPKVERARELIDRHGYTCDIQIDGGISPETAPLAARAGANVLVAGSAIFLQPDPPAAARAIRAAADSAV
ncbi:MAG TPA: ribulose-phosphate 3-epimerase [Actinomycetota bacterium]